MEQKEKVQRILGEIDMDLYPKDYPKCITCKKRYHKSLFSITYDRHQKNNEYVLRCDSCVGSNMQKLAKQLRNISGSMDC